jgi:transposase InsO family protein
MAYTINKHAPKVRRDVSQLVLNKGLGIRTVARQYGVSPGTISKWVKKAKKIGLHPIPTLSSKPKHHPYQLSDEITWKIFKKRLERNRCAEVVQKDLENKGVKVSLSSVKRTLDRNGLLKKKSPWKRYHPPVDRPYPLKQGDLVQMDTIHLMTGPKTRIYIFTLIDVYSRWSYAKCYEKMSSKICVNFLNEAQRSSSFNFNMLQSDHGPEFGRWFIDRSQKNHRYTRVGKPNDNAHIERFNRTLQEECLDKVPTNPKDINCALRKYLRYYNSERLHLGINLKTPSQLLTECFQAIG